jgi:hypothetical protein
LQYKNVVSSPKGASKELRFNAGRNPLFGLASAVVFIGGHNTMGSLLTEQEGRLAEISGWDTGENFFVERAFLHHSQNGGNKVGLRARLRVGSLLFVRLFDQESMDRMVPVTFRVAALGDGKSVRGTWEVHITRAHPREKDRTPLVQFTFRETVLN